MSSILDALNKLEQEKAQSRRELEGTPADPVSAAHDLVGRSVLRDRVTVRISPATLIVSGGALLTLILAIALVVTISLGGSDDPEVTASAISPSGTSRIPELDLPATSPSTSSFVRLPDPAPTPMPTQIQAGPPPVPTNAPQDPKLDTSQPAAAAPPPVSTQQVAPAVVSRTEPEPAPPKQEPARAATRQATAPEPEPDPPAHDLVDDEPPAAPTRVARSAEDVTSRSNRSLPASEAPATRAPRNEDLSTLPILTDSDVRRFGLVQLKINMPSPAGPSNPQGSAILTLREEADDGSVIANTMKFYEGQRLQTTTLRLFKVERDAVGIEDMRSGERFQLRF